MFRSITLFCFFALTVSCGPTVISSGSASLVGGASQFQVTGPLLDTPPVTSPDDVNFGTLVNGIRRGEGLTDVVFDSRLNEAAQKHAQDMVDNDYFNHISQDGRTPDVRIRAEGYIPAYSGENIASTPQTDQQALDAWLSSVSHANLMLDNSLPGQVAEDFALGVAGQGINTKWVLIMAREQ
jgi:uncharacterized protein YkwD